MCSKIRWSARPLTVWRFWFLGGKVRTFWLSPQPQGKKVGHLCEDLCFTLWEELKDSPTDKAKSPLNQVLSAAYLLLTSEVTWKKKLIMGKKLIIQWSFLSINKPFHSLLSGQKHPLLTPDTRPEETVCSPLNLSQWNCFREYNTRGDKKIKEMWAPCSVRQLLPAHLVQSGQLVCEWLSAHTETPRIREEHVIHVWSKFCIKDCAVNLRGSFSYFLRNWLLWLLSQNAVCLIRGGRTNDSLDIPTSAELTWLTPIRIGEVMGLRRPSPLRLFLLPEQKSKTCCVVLQLVKLGNIFKLSALPSASEEKSIFSLFPAKTSSPLNIFSHIWLHVQDFFFSKNK